jgi:hypothetical protein
VEEVINMATDKIELTRNCDEIIIIPNTCVLEAIMRHIIGISSYTKIKRDTMHDIIDKIYDEYE